MIELEAIFFQCHILHIESVKMKDKKTPLFFFLHITQLLLIKTRHDDSVILITRDTERAMSRHPQTRQSRKELEVNCIFFLIPSSNTANRTQCNIYQQYLHILSR